MDKDTNKDVHYPRETSTSIADVICEFLEVASHLILYCRGVYPDGIFKKCRKYNVAAMMSCHPDLNCYIKDVLVGIRLLISTGNVERVTLQIVTKENKPVERYVFELLLFGDIDRDKEYESPDLERQLRDLLLKIHTSDAVLKPLPDDCSFVVSVQTKDSVGYDLINGEHFEGFPWVKSDEKDDTAECLTKPGIIPLKSCSTKHFDLQCFVETNMSVDT